MAFLFLSQLPALPVSLPFPSPLLLYAPRTHTHTHKAPHMEAPQRCPEIREHRCRWFCWCFWWWCAAVWWTFAGSSCASSAPSLYAPQMKMQTDNGRQPTTAATAKAATAAKAAATSAATTATSDDDVAFLETMKQTGPGTDPSRVRWQLCLVLAPRPFGHARFCLFNMHLNYEPTERHTKTHQHTHTHTQNNQTTLALIHNYFYVSALIKSCKLFIPFPFSLATPCYQPFPIFLLPTFLPFFHFPFSSFALYPGFVICIPHLDSF